MTQLRYVSTDKAGYARKKRGRGFSYYDPQGQLVRDKELRQWIESIVIPPAWTDVWISPHKNGHILATGRDDKSRKQYRYHPLWQEKRNQKKFDYLYQFGKCLPVIRTVTDEHLRQRKISKERVLAAIVRLLESTLIRIGNIEYLQQNDSYGLTTLTDDHVQISKNRIIFDFIGKSGKEHSIGLHDQRLARIVKHCQDIPGYELFQYYDENGNAHVVDAADVNGYLQDITGKDFTAKVFRTWGGSTRAIKYLCEICTEKDPETAARECVIHVAESLGNTALISRKYYIHPAIMDSFLTGDLKHHYKKHQKKWRSTDDLTPEEQTLMSLIEEID